MGESIINPSRQVSASVCKLDLCTREAAFKTLVLICTDDCALSALFANGKRLLLGSGQWLL